MVATAAMIDFLANACCARPPDKNAQDPAGPTKPMACQLIGTEGAEDTDGSNNGFQSCGITDFSQSKKAVASRLKVRFQSCVVVVPIDAISSNEPIAVGTEVIFVGCNCTNKTGKVMKWSPDASSVQVSSLEDGRVKTFWVAVGKPEDVVCLRSWNSELRKGIDSVTGTDPKGNTIQGICKNTSGAHDDMRVSVMNPATGKVVWLEAGQWTRIVLNSQRAHADTEQANTDPPQEGDEVIILDHNNNVGKKGLLHKIQYNGAGMGFKVKIEGNKYVFAQAVCKSQYWTD